MNILTVGDPAPWFTAASSVNPNYHFDTVGGHRVILCFFGDASVPAIAPIVDQFLALQPQLAALNVPFFGVTANPQDQPLAERVQAIAYCKFFWDFDLRISRLYGVCAQTPGGAEGDWRYQPTTYVLDENLRVVGVFPMESGDQHVQQVLNRVQSLPSFPAATMAQRQAPVLLIPHVLDPAFCQELIQRYEADGGKDSGFMRQIEGKTVEILDPGFKKRRDYLVNEPVLLERINTLILRRIKPEIEKAFQFRITRFERHLVACYEATNQGFFNRHRDNTTKGTVHRRFAMTLNLNAGEYEGGCLTFPEYGAQLYRPNTGEAVIFSCSLLHEATPVTQGRRYALLSFFYNDEDAKVREQNRQYVELRQPKEAQVP